METRAQQKLDKAELKQEIAEVKSEMTEIKSLLQTLVNKQANAGPGRHDSGSSNKH